ncbi:pentatricopeptide repeat-containing protein [Prunus dulcis]|uniref:Pentatricopeptide repeat-containing protein n=1 Tax=Prunus dulcis TaxID=3755 RepID=A0A4Y1QRG2_PRUDU|nr:pentatricopeptide repeat-containing protein [Prunus dulcis]
MRFYLLQLSTDLNDFSWRCPITKVPLNKLFPSTKCFEEFHSAIKQYNTTQYRGQKSFICSIKITHHPKLKFKTREGCEFGR